MSQETYADCGCDSDATRVMLRWRGIAPVIGARAAKHGSGCGGVHCVVERSIGWLKSMRRMRLRYERLVVIQRAWNSLAASVVCLRLLRGSMHG